MSKEFNKDKYYEEKDQVKEAIESIKVNSYLESSNAAREKRIKETMELDKTLTREQAEEHIDYMDSERFSEWVMGNRTSLELSDEKMERALEKELENTTKFQK